MQLQTIENLLIPSVQSGKWTEEEYRARREEAAAALAALEAELPALEADVAAIRDRQAALLDAIADAWRDERARAALLAEYAAQSALFAAAPHALERATARIAALRTKLLTLDSHLAEFERQRIAAAEREREAERRAAEREAERLAALQRALAGRTAEELAALEARELQRASAAERAEERAARIAEREAAARERLADLAAYVEGVVKGGRRNGR